MSFYDLNTETRAKLVNKIKSDILNNLSDKKDNKIIKYFSDDDTYIRKAAYQSISKIYFSETILQSRIISLLEGYLINKEPKVRQTSVNTAGEIGMKDFESIEHLMDKGLTDEHHSVRNAVIGSLKKTSEKNPEPALKWASQYLHHPDKEIRREVCHGIELRGRTHPQDVLPLLKELQYDDTARVRNTLIHVIGQIAYKKGCLAVVINELNKWTNKAVVGKSIKEIIDVHESYKNFAELTKKEAVEYIKRNYKKLI